MIYRLLVCFAWTNVVVQVACALTCFYWGAWLVGSMLLFWGLLLLVQAYIVCLHDWK